MTDTEREATVIAIVACLSPAAGKLKRIHDGGRVAGHPDRRGRCDRAS